MYRARGWSKVLLVLDGGHVGGEGGVGSGRGAQTAEEEGGAPSLSPSGLEELLLFYQPGVSS